MSLSQVIGRIDEALIDHKPLCTIRGMLFSLLEQAEAHDETLRSLEARLGRDPLLKENDRLRSQLNDAFDLVERLQAEADGHIQIHCSKAQDDILHCIACLGPHTTADLVETLDLEGESIHYHLIELQKVDFLNVDCNFEWSLLQAGRKYLKQHGLLH